MSGNNPWKQPDDDDLDTWNKYTGGGGYIYDDEKEKERILAKEYKKYSEEANKKKSLEDEIIKKNRQENNFLVEHLYQAYLNGGEETLKFTFSEDVKNNTSFSVFLALSKKDDNLLQLAIANRVNPFNKISDRLDKNIFETLAASHLDSIFSLAKTHPEYLQDMQAKGLHYYLKTNNLLGVEKFFDYDLNFITGYQNKITFLANFSANFVYHLFQNNKINLRDLEQTDQTNQNFYSFLLHLTQTSVEHAKTALDLNLPLYQNRSLLMKIMAECTGATSGSLIKFIQKNHTEPTIQSIVHLMKNHAKLEHVPSLSIYKKIKENIFEKNRSLFNSIDEEYLLHANVDKTIKKSTNKIL